MAPKRTAGSRIAAAVIIAALLAWVQAPLCSAATAHFLCANPTSQTHAAHGHSGMKHACCPGKAEHPSCAPKKKADPQSCGHERDCCAVSTGETNKQAVVATRTEPFDHVAAVVRVVSFSALQPDRHAEWQSSSEATYVKPVCEKKVDLRI